MNYIFSNKVRDNDILRESFNKLTRQTFGFDFINWYALGHWGKWYIPQALLDGEKVVSNVSVNLMQFDMQGVQKNYIQLGTVMTDKDYRGQGLNRQIMERVLEEYVGKVDGIYLFGNDEVLDYYPKFGFQASKEYEYYMSLGSEDVGKLIPYALEKVDMSDKEQSEQIVKIIKAYPDNSGEVNENDGLYMSENLGLYQFWLDAAYANQVYYVPEVGVYVIAEWEKQVLRIHQIFGKQRVDIPRLAQSFEEQVQEVVLGYVPMDKTPFRVREHKEEDCTLFILGEDLEGIENEKLMFPILSHA